MGTFYFLYSFAFLSLAFMSNRLFETRTYLTSVGLLHLFVARRSGVGRSGADKQLVPADHPLPHVHLIQPDVGLPYQGLLHELASIGNQEELEIQGRGKTA